MKKRTKIIALSAGALVLTVLAFVVLVNHKNVYFPHQSHSFTYIVPGGGEFQSLSVFIVGVSNTNHNHMKTQVVDNYGKHYKTQGKMQFYKPYAIKESYQPPAAFYSNYEEVGGSKITVTITNNSDKIVYATTSIWGEWTDFWYSSNLFNSDF